MVFSQVPQHPKPRWKADESRLQDAQHSEPWYKAVQGLKPVDARAASMAPVNGNSAEGYAGPTSGVPRYQRGNANGTMGSAGSVGSRGIGTVSGLRSLSSRPVVPFVTGMTGISCCSSNLYAVGEDGCLRVQPLPTADPPFDAEIEKPVARRNFRISPMPLSALAVLESELLALGGHDNTVSLYSTSCGSSLSKSSMHADTVTCLGVSHCKSLLVSGSRDQSVVAWQVTPSGLKNDVIFDDLQQPVVCAACSGSLVLAAASDKRLICWDRRSGQAILDRELDGIATACALSDATASASGCTYAAGLDNAGELRLWDLRQCSESLRLQTTANSPLGLVTANCHSQLFLNGFFGLGRPGWCCAHRTCHGGPVGHSAAARDPLLDFGRSRPLWRQCFGHSLPPEARCCVGRLAPRGAVAVRIILGTSLCLRRMRREVLKDIASKSMGAVCVQETTTGRQIGRAHV